VFDAKMKITQSKDVNYVDVDWGDTDDSDGDGDDDDDDDDDDFADGPDDDQC
jgi:hypothetical protein